jgi:short-subunit dehydrogenase
MASFSARFGPWAIVAGASEGIGAAFATQLAAMGLNLILVARREAPLRELSDSLSLKYGVETLALALDLSSAEAAASIQSAAATRDVGLLVFNAAAASIAEFSDAATDALEKIVALNCTGLVRVVKSVVPHLIARGGGGLLLMSSMSGFRGHACAATYAASKAFTTSLGEGLWAELEPQGVTVRVCAAGATLTPNFMSVTPEAKRETAFPMSPERVAELGLLSLQRDGRRGALVIPGLINRFAAFLMARLLCSSLAVWLMSKSLRDIYSMPVRRRGTAGS